MQKNERKQDGKCPVTVSLSVEQFSNVTFSTKLNVPVSLWMSVRTIGKSHTAIAINHRLDEILAYVLYLHRELSAVNEKVSAEEVKNLVLGMASGQKTLLLFQCHNEKFQQAYRCKP